MPPVDEITEFMHDLHVAWRAADVENYLAAFAEDADLVGRTGQRYSGRAEIAAQLRKLARAGRPALFAAERRIDTIRLIAPTVAVVHETWIEPDRTVHATYVLTRRERWLISATSTVLRQ
ncbi:MAG TPA: SgcJ/EcaC family oxidoreductase [Mycobacteriales bacterium]|nr:SgcJ/EcaC family oxidoreductase [Mycobacteriales bacterium]